MKPLSVPKRICFLLLPVSVLLVSVELAARVFSDPIVTHRQSAVEPDPDLLWRLIPRPGRTNSLGFRDREPRAQANRRVLVLGDSVSWGHGVPLGRIFPVRLEELLDQSDSGQRYDVINTGVPGYSTFQEARLLELRGLDLSPSLIILQICLNDIVERYDALAQYGGDGEFLGIDTRHAIPGVFGWLLRHSRAFGVLARMIAFVNHNRTAYEVENLLRDKLGPELEEAWDTMLAEVDDIRILAAEAEIPLLIVVAPYSFQVDGSHPGRQPQDRLLAYAAEHNTPMIDLLPHLRLAREHGSSPLFRDPSHLSAEGHDVVARALLPPVLEALQLAER